MTKEDRVCVGAIAGAFGVKGEARLKSFCSTPEDIATYGPLWLEDGARSFTVTLTRPVTGGMGARLTGLATKEEIDALKGATLWADRDRLPSLPDDEFYHTDLIGLPVFDAGGVQIGKVRAVQNFGAGDILEIEASPEPGKKARRFMVPMTARAVPAWDGDSVTVEAAFIE